MGVSGHQGWGLMGEVAAGESSIKQNLALTTPHTNVWKIDPECKLSYDHREGWVTYWDPNTDICQQTEANGKLSRDLEPHKKKHTHTHTLTHVNVFTIKIKKKSPRLMHLCEFVCMFFFTCFFIALLFSLPLQIRSNQRWAQIGSGLHQSEGKDSVL